MENRLDANESGILRNEAIQRENADACIRNGEAGVDPQDIRELWRPASARCGAESEVAVECMEATPKQIRNTSKRQS